jgi:hypothetical protein
VKTLVYVFLTNGYGESWAGNSVYVQLIQSFSTAEARTALSLIVDQDISNRLNQPRSQNKFRELLTLIDPKIVAKPRRDLLEAVAPIPNGQLHAARFDPNVKQLLAGARRASKAASGRR